MIKSEALEESVQYFKSNKGFKRMMEKIKNKYLSFDRETPRKYHNRKSIKRRKRRNIWIYEKRLFKK